MNRYAKGIWVFLFLSGCASQATDEARNPSSHSHLKPRSPVHGSCDPDSSMVSGKATLIRAGDQRFVVVFKSVHGSAIRCLITKNRHFHPRKSIGPKALYEIVSGSSENCRADRAWVSNSLVNAGRGHIDIEFPCGEHACHHEETAVLASLNCQI